MATCIFYRNGRLSGRDNEVLARSKRQHYYKPRILGSKKNYGLKFTLHLAFFYCFTFYAGFPHWMAFGRLRGFMQPSAPIGPFLRRPSLGRRRRRWHGNSRGHNCRTFSGYFFYKWTLFLCESDPNRRERSSSKAGPPAHFTGQESPRYAPLRSERARPSSVWNATSKRDSA